MYRRNQFLYHDANRKSLFVSIWGLIFEFPDQDRLHALSFAMHDDFDRGLQELIFHALKPGDVFVDVGASAGVMTALGARAVGQTGFVLAFEALPHLAPIVTTNLTRNAPTTPKLFVSGAAYDSATALVFQHYAEDSRVSTAFAFPAGHYDPALLETLNVSASRVDEHCPPGRPVRLAKIDAEGAELMVLRGLEGILARSPDLEIVLEWAPEHFSRAGYAPADILTWMSEHRFYAETIDGITGSRSTFEPANPSANIILIRM